MADIDNNPAQGVDPVAIHCRTCGTTMLALLVQGITLPEHICPLCGAQGDFYVVDNTRVIRGVG
jgi:hypothetical protein